MAASSVSPSIWATSWLATVAMSGSSGALGEGGDFLLGGCDGDAVVELEAKEAGFPGFEDFLQAAGGLDAERAFEREEQAGARRRAGR